MYAHAYSLGDEVCFPPCQWHRMPTTQETDGFQVKRPGDLNVKCTLLLMLDHQVTRVWSHRESSGGRWAASCCKPFLSCPVLPLWFLTRTQPHPLTPPCSSPASPVQIGPPTGKAAGGAHTDQGGHHAGPVALYQTQPTAGRARARVYQLQPVLPPGELASVLRTSLAAPALPTAPQPCGASSWPHSPH